MELATFGAVLTFAIDFEARLGALYTALGASIPAMAAEMAQGAAACARRGTLLERVRRENVTEMILEPIHGFDGDAYALPEQGADVAAVVRQAETVAAGFYRAGAGHLSIPEVKRAFDRLAKEHARAAG
jgi:hypothetical protein